MRTKERIVEALRRFGLQPNDDGEQVAFCYQMVQYVYYPDESDDCYMAFYLPCIYQVTEDNETEVLKAINECNIFMKTSKLISANEYVWAAYEIYVPETGDVDEFVVRAIRCLYESKIRFDMEIKGL